MRTSTPLSSFLIFLLTALLPFMSFAESCETSVLFTEVSNNLTVGFSDESTSTCQIVAWNWNLGDGTYSTIEHPTHTYPYASTYHVCLTLTLEDEEGLFEESVSCKEIVIENGLPCALNANFESLVDNDGSVLLTENCNSGFFTNIESFEWSFGDGTTDEGEFAAHTYIESGTYDVCLTVHGSTGESTCQNAQCIELEVAIVLPVISASFEIKSADHCRIIPKATSLPVENVQVIQHRWELSDGRVFFGDQPEIDLLQNGELEICLIEECLTLGQYQEFISCQSIEVDCVTSQEIQAPSMDVTLEEASQDENKKFEVKRFTDQIQLRSSSSESTVVSLFDASGRLLGQYKLSGGASLNIPLFKTGLVIVQMVTAEGFLAVYRTCSL